MGLNLPLWAGLDIPFEAQSIRRLEQFFDAVLLKQVRGSCVGKHATNRSVVDVNVRTWSLGNRL
jgi:hypothetical protein